MPTYIALIHRDAESYGVSFPDIPGLITAGDSIDEAIEEAEEALAFAAEDWTDQDGSIGLKPPRTIEQLRKDPNLVEALNSATIIEIDLPAAE
jgi:antitoxin HicB